jgi:hypothetical protein
MSMIGFLATPVVKWLGKAVILREDLTYIARNGTAYVTEAGLFTDLASVPKIFATIAALLGAGWQETAAAGILHDGLYASGRVSRELADDLFREALEESGLAAWKAKVMWRTVRWFGGRAWRRHRANDWIAVPVDVPLKSRW